MSSQGSTDPLKWPEYWRSPTDVQKFLKGVPFVGIDKRARRQFSKLLKKRGSGSLASWGRDPEILRMLLVVSPIIKEEMEWPNVYFIPEDPCDILFFDPTMDMLSVEAVIAIEDACGIEESRILEDMSNLSYRELIVRLVKLKEHHLGGDGSNHA